MKESSQIQVAEREDGAPRLINWRGQTYSVQRIVKEWTEKKRFRRTEKRFFHVETNEGTFEIVHDGARWHFGGVVGSDAWVDSDLEAPPHVRRRDDPSS